jgi:hypothetical protein
MTSQCVTCGTKENDPCCPGYVCNWDQGYCDQGKNLCETSDAKWKSPCSKPENCISPDFPGLTCIANSDPKGPKMICDCDPDVKSGHAGEACAADKVCSGGGGGPSPGKGTPSPGKNPAPGGTTPAPGGTTPAPGGPPSCGDKSVFPSGYKGDCGKDAKTACVNTKDGSAMIQCGGTTCSGDFKQCNPNLAAF